VSEDDREFILVTVKSVVRDQRSNPVVLLKADGGDEVLPIWIGHAEGIAIELQLKGETFERPLTHDLLKTTLECLGASVAKVAITELRDNTFFARIHLTRENEVFAVDARPSDSIAIALKTGAPIYVSGEVFAGHKRALQEGGGGADDPDDELRRYLEDLDPGDF